MRNLVVEALSLNQALNILGISKYVPLNQALKKASTYTEQKQ